MFVYFSKKLSKLERLDDLKFELEGVVAKT
jgi:hypothetical protein